MLFTYCHFPQKKTLFQLKDIFEIIFSDSKIVPKFTVLDTPNEKINRFARKCDMNHPVCRLS